MPCATLTEKDPITMTNGDCGKDYSGCHVSKSLMRAVLRNRNFIAFWIFGIGTYFPFVISLSAAHDVLDKGENNLDNRSTNNKNYENNTSGINLTYERESDSFNYLKCNPTSIGVILLSAILPDLCVKIIMSWSVPQIPYNIKVIITAGFSAASFLMMALAGILWLRLFGVVCASISCGLGEIAFTSLSCYYDREVVSAWSSGTGASGILGSLLYAWLISMGVSVQRCMLMILIIPLSMLPTYAFILEPVAYGRIGIQTSDIETRHIVDKEMRRMSLREKCRSVSQMSRYLVPLFVVYVGVYFIIQGLVEFLYFDKQIISPAEQYRWYQVCYRIAVFLSRSSVYVLQVKKLFLLPLIPFAIIVLLVFQVFYRFIPSLWILMTLVFFDGFVQGLSYANTFYYITNDLQLEKKEFALRLATMSRPLGIVLAGCISIPVHDYLCSLNLTM